MRKLLLSTIVLFSCLAACKKSAGPPRPFITGFTPSKGAAGIAVTISGHFDSTRTQLAVSFNGTPATVYSSSDSQIVVIVPNGVTTGKITVSVNNQSATTDSNFVVLAGGWTEMAHRPFKPNEGLPLVLGIGFAIGNYGYMGFGTDDGSDYSDLYRFDPASNTWTQMASMGVGLGNLVSMVIGDKAYVGIGMDGDLPTGNSGQFYEYDPSTDTWTRKGDFPGVARQGAFAFTIGGLGYVALGASGLLPVDQYDVWQYDPSNDTWTQKANFPAVGGDRFPTWGTAFSPDNKVGYVVGSAGFDISTELVWRYDPASDSWTQLRNLPTMGMEFPSSIVLNGTGYLLGGGQECWKYDPSSDSWTQLAFFGDRIAGAAFALNGKGYYGMGKEYFADLPYLDFWQFTP